MVSYRHNTPMSGRQEKKVRKIVRKQFTREVGAGIEALKRITRKRPAWIPKAVWAYTYLPLFKRKYIHLVREHLD